MRYLSIVIVALLGGAAGADTGVYMDISGGGAEFRGGLAAYGDTGGRVQLGFGVRRNAWTYAGIAGATIGDRFEHGCEGNVCFVPSNNGSFTYVGGDVRRSWLIATTRYRRLSAAFVTHGGPRLFIGQDALQGYSGPGVSMGAGIEGNAWVIGYFLDVGLDAMWLKMPADSVGGVSPHLMFGAKLGWL